MATITKGIAGGCMMLASLMIGGPLLAAFVVGAMLTTGAQAYRRQNHERRHR